MPARVKNLLIWLTVVVSIIFLFNMFDGQSSQHKNKIDYSQFLDDVTQGNITSVTIMGRNVEGSYKSGGNFTTYTPEDPNLISVLNDNNVTIRAQPPQEGLPTIVAILIQWFPMLLFVGIWIFFMRQMQGGGGKAMGFGRSKAKLLTENKDKVTFEDVAGIEEAKQELEEIVEYLQNPTKFEELGGRIPRGALLIGAPGTGKTLTARAVAGEADVPFFSISGSDFVEMFVGVGASRVRDMFEQGKKNAPCIIFIDEIDAVGRHRGAGLGGGNDEREQTLNQILVEMDGFSSNDGVIIIAATNRPDVLDPALLRPGRFDRQVIVPSPDIKGREAILEVHARKVKTSPDVDCKVIARGTPGFSGAELANIVNEAALLAARRDRKFVSMKEMEDAKDKVMMGAERRSMVMSEDERQLTAFHEAGHAVVMLHAEGHEPLHKVTIIPRGRALGVTFALPEKDRLSMSYKQLTAQITSLFGGRIAEELIFGKENITTGASNDIQQATKLARRMVTEFGFSDKLGPLRYSDNEEEVFLGHSVAQRKNLSDQTASIIDAEVKNLVESGEKEARSILTKFKHQLDAIAYGLLERETLSREEIDELVSATKPKGKKSKAGNGPKKPTGSFGVINQPKPA